MSFLKRLFGGGSASADAGGSGTAAPGESYGGCEIRATPYQENGQWQMCGVIEKTIDGEKRSHRFVRADRFATESEAQQFTLSKARQIVDQMGDSVFR